MTSEFDAKLKEIKPSNHKNGEGPSHTATPQMFPGVYVEVTVSDFLLLTVPQSIVGLEENPVA
jgi:hypothetical protein